MTKQTENNTGQIWIILFTVLPILFALQLVDYFKAWNISTILLSGIVGALGGAIGAGLAVLFKNAKVYIKILALVGLMGIGTGALYVLERTSPDLETCEICGYKTFEETTLECEVCGCDNWEEAKTYEDLNHQQWVQFEQHFHFYDDEFEEEDFYEENPDFGYEKDKDWKPSISVEDIMNPEFGEDWE